MAALTVQSIDEDGLTPSYSAAGGSGDTIADDGTQRTFLHVKNGGAGSVTVTVTAQVTSRSAPGMGSMTKADLSVAIAAGAEAMIGPFAPDAFKDSSGLVHVGYSGTTSVTVAAIKLPNLG